MSTPKPSGFANHYLLESELSPKVNIAMSSIEDLPGDVSYSGEVRIKLATPSFIVMDKNRFLQSPRLIGVTYV